MGNTTTTTIAEPWNVVKERLLSMSLDDKRGLYRCGSDYVKLNSVPTWSQHCQEHPPQFDPNDERAFTPDDKINGKVSLWKGDITRLEVDCVVNAANESLLGGGGVDGTIHVAAGEHLVEECRTLDGCEVGSAKITGGYKLPSKYVIHAVGPRDQKPAPLKSAYVTSLNLMKQNQLRSIAFPCISTGIFGYPVEDAAHVALLAVRHFMDKNADTVDRVILATFTDQDFGVYEKLMPRYFPLK